MRITTCSASQKVLPGVGSIARALSIDVGRMWEKPVAPAAMAAAFKNSRREGADIVTLRRRPSRAGARRRRRAGILLSWPESRRHFHGSFTDDMRRDTGICMLNACGE